MTPEYLRSRFVFRDNVNSYHLRNTENTLTLPQTRTDYLQLISLLCTDPDVFAHDSTA